MATLVTVASVDALELDGEGRNGPDGSRHVNVWHPGETKDMDFYVENQSPITDSIAIEATVSDPYWTYSLNRTLIEDVPPWERVYFKLSVTAPLHGNPGDRAYINVTVSALKTNRTDTLSWILFMIVEREITMVHTGEPFYEMDNTSVVSTVVRVNNIGDLPVNVTMGSSTTENGEAIDDWVRVTMDPVEFELPKGEGTNVSVFIEVLSPMQLKSSSEYRTFIRAQAEEAESVWSGASVFWGVAETFEASIDPEMSTFMVAPNDELSMRLSLTQSTNNHTGHTWRPSMHNLPAGWWANFDEEPYEVTGPGSFVVDMVVGVPGRTTPGTEVVLEVLFTCDQLPDVKLRSILEFEFKAVHFVQFFVAPKYQRYTVEDMTEGTTARYNVTLVNKGNVQEYLKMEIGTDGSRGTDSLGFINPREAGVSLQPYSEYMFSFEVVVDRLTPAKEYWIHVNFSWDHVPIPSYRVFLEVDPYMDLKCSMEISPEPIINPNLPEPVVILSMENVGNLRVPYVLQWSVLPVGGGVHLRGEHHRMSDLHILQSASSRNHTLRLFVSNGEDGREYDDGSFQLFVHHYDGHVMWNGTIEYQVTIPDLAVRDYGFDAPVIVGEPNLVLVTVENRGDGWSRETMVVLVRESNGEEINRTKVPKLAPGGKVSVPMDFILEASRDFFVITVDPDDDVNEAGDGDNSRRFGVTGMVTGPGTPSPAFSFLLGFLIMLALTVGAFGAYHLWKSRT